jgi:hypothetical protein
MKAKAGVFLRGPQRYRASLEGLDSYQPALASFCGPSGTLVHEARLLVDDSTDHTLPVVRVEIQGRKV